jgi:dephospho-CoA kinase
MIIGLTGGIGSGKSTIAMQLRLMGYEVYDTDSEAKRIIVEDAHVRAQMTALFGEEVYRDGMYQTAYVAQRVFADKTLLAKLNAIVHPAVKADIVSKFRSSGVTSEPSAPSEPLNSDSGLFFVECAILYQAGIDELCDKVVVVTAPEDLRLERVIARDCSDINKVRARMRAQSPDLDLSRGDIVINNTNNISVCIQNVVQYEVRPGESYADLLIRTGLSYLLFKLFNPHLLPGNLLVGQKYFAPKDDLCCAPVSAGRSYLLQSGENLQTAAQALGVSVGALLRSNPHLSPADFVEGTSVRY